MREIQLAYYVKQQPQWKLRSGFTRCL